MTAAIIASQQILVALEAIASGPTHREYAWAWRYFAESAPKALAAMADSGERTRVATTIRVAKSRARQQRALQLRADGLTAAATGERMATEEGRPETPFDERTVRRWLRAGISSR
jgi:hypothetical protein